MAKEWDRDAVLYKEGRKCRRALASRLAGLDSRLVYGFHPANLALRLMLELSALVAIGFGAYTLADGLLAWLLAVGSR